MKTGTARRAIPRVIREFAVETAPELDLLKNKLRQAESERASTQRVLNDLHDETSRLVVEIVLPSERGTKFVTLEQILDDPDRFSFRRLHLCGDPECQASVADPKIPCKRERR